MKFFDTILASKKTVFSYDDIRMMTGIQNKHTLKKFFERARNAWMFQKIHKWLYALPKYDIFELAVKIKQNSYISFETVLKREGIIFQDYWDTIFLASDNTITKGKFIFLKLKKSILQNPIWIQNTWHYSIASPERAICDRIYLTKNYYFDNLESVNFEKLKKIAQIYNKRVILEINTLIKNAQSR